MQQKNTLTQQGLSVSRPLSRKVSGARSLPKISDEKFNLYKSPEGYRAIMSWYDDVLEMIDVEVESRYVKTSFGYTHMLCCGPVDAEPVILIPGIAGCAPLWRSQLPAFAKQFRVYALDILGQPGRSDPYPISFLNDDHVHWLAEVLDGLNIEKAHFAGTSVGGWLVMRMAIVAPQRVNKLVMLSPTGIARAKFPVRIMVTRVLNKRKDANALENDLTAKSVSAKTHGGSFGTFDRQLARLMALCTRHYRVDRSIGIHNEASGKINLLKGFRVLRKFFLSEPKSTLQQLQVPGLLIFGEHEILYKPEQIAKRTRKLIPSLAVEIVSGAGHAAIYDKPDETNEMIVQYLSAPA